MRKKLMNAKNKGSVAIVILLFYMLLTLLIFLASTIVYKISVKKAEDTQDDLHLSNLAVYKDIDMTALAQDDSSIKISDCQSAFNTFKSSLQNNMDLDSNMNGLENSAAVGQVTIKEFIIYNVKGNYVEIYSYDPNTQGFIRSEVADKSKSAVKTPNNSIVKNTTLHTAISFNIKSMFGKLQPVSVSVDTDITK